MMPRDLVSEEDFQQSITDLAGLNGFLVYHTHDSRRSQPGFPDLVLCRPPYLLFVEVKRERGVVSQDQALWLKWLGESDSITAEVWRPSSWRELASRLAAGGGRK